MKAFLRRVAAWLLSFLQEPGKPVFYAVLYYRYGRVSTEVCDTLAIAQGRMRAAARAGKAVRGEIVNARMEVIRHAVFLPLDPKAQNGQEHTAG